MKVITEPSNDKKPLFEYICLVADLGEGKTQQKNLQTDCKTKDTFFETI